MKKSGFLSGATESLEQGEFLTVVQGAFAIDANSDVSNSDSGYHEDGEGDQDLREGHADHEVTRDEGEGGGEGYE